MKSANTRVLLLTGAGHSAAHAWELIFPAVAIPLARDFGLSFEEAVELAWPLYLLFGLGAPLAGVASDKFGPRVVLLTCLLGGGVAGVVVSMVEGTTALAFALGGLGLAASLYHPSGLALLSVYFERRMGRAFAINGIAGNIGIAATPLVAGIAASAFGWRAAYLILSIPALVVGAAFLFMPFPDRRKSALVVGQPEKPSEVRRWQPLVTMALIVTAGGLAYRLHTLVMPALIAERIPYLGSWVSALGFQNLEHADNLAATALTSVAYGMGIFGQWWGGRIADRRPLVSSYFFFHLAALPLVALAAWASGWLLLFALFFYVFFAIGMQPIENSLVAKLSGSTWRGRAYAGKFVLGFGVGSFGTYVIGFVTPYGGLGAVLATAAVMEVVLISAVVYLSRQVAPST